jgi:hypothetical protein
MTAQIQQQAQQHESQHAQQQLQQQQDKVHQSSLCCIKALFEQSLLQQGRTLMLAASRAAQKLPDVK